jgi:hypothetical protein
MAKEKEIVIPVSKVKSRKKVEHIEAKEELLDELEENPWHVNKINNDLKVGDDGKILVSFTKFVQLIAVHDFADLMDKYSNEHITISSDLLVELAGAPTDEIPESKFSWVFLGAILGAVAAAIIFMLFVN